MSKETTLKAISRLEVLMSKTAMEIEIMRAYLRGHTIEVRGKNEEGKWNVAHEPHWAWGINNYRVKPEPQYVTVYFPKEDQSWRSPKLMMPGGDVAQHFVAKRCLVIEDDNS